MDLCLAVELLRTDKAKNVTLHFKNIPWFVSDATISDLEHMVEQIRKAAKTSSSLLVNNFVELISKYIQNNSLSLKESNLWTFPHSYWHLDQFKTHIEELRLYDSDLLIFKGDLNYRKLVHDCTFENLTFAEATMAVSREIKAISVCNSLGKNIVPKILTLRVCKSDAISGIDPEINKNLTKKSKDWKITGEYAVIQFSG